MRKGHTEKEDWTDAVELHVAVDPILVATTHSLIEELREFCEARGYPVIRCFYRNLEWEEIEEL